MNKKALKITIGVLLLLTISIIASWYYSTRGEESFLKHLANKTLKIENFEITYQQRRVECNNKKVCSYLSNMFIFEGRERLDGCYSTSYKIKIKFNDGIFFVCPMSIGSKGFSLSIPKYDVFGEEIPTHFYHLADDAPSELKGIHIFLDLSWKEAQGKVLKVNDNSNTIIFERLLVVP